METVQDKYDEERTDLLNKLNEFERNASKTIKNAEAEAKRSLRKKKSDFNDKFEKELKELRDESNITIMGLKEQISSLRKGIQIESERRVNLRKEKYNTEVELSEKKVDAKRATLRLPLNADYDHPVSSEKSIRTLERKVDRLRSELKSQILEYEELQDNLEDITKKVLKFSLIKENEVRERVRIENEKKNLEQHYSQKLAEYELNLSNAEKEANEAQKAQLELNKTKTKLENLSKTLKKNESVISDYQYEIEDIKHKYDAFAESINVLIDDERKKSQELETRIVFLENDLEREKKRIAKEVLNNKNLENQINKLKELLKEAEAKVNQLMNENSQSQRELRYAERHRGIPI